MNRHILGLWLAVAFTAACSKSSTTEAPKTEAPAAAPAAAAQPAAKVSHEFHGKVVAVDATEKAMTVNGENVEGWMSAMTMKYSADKPEIFATVKAGDEITATVFDGDFATLHDVKIIAPAK
jgi:Cu/Ag efflux protein CusF